MKYIKIIQIMSKIGKAPVKILTGVTFKTEDKNKFGGKTVVVTGPKGSLTLDMQKGIDLKEEAGEMILTRASDGKQMKAYHGLYRSLLNNMVNGVVNGYEKKLEIQGIGYKAELNGNKLSLKVGYSHPIVIEAPEGLTFEVKDGVNITLRGFDKQVVGEYAARIRKARKPEPYKGKGIRYSGEIVKRKQGKAAGAAK